MNNLNEAFVNTNELRRKKGYFKNIIIKYYIIDKDYDSGAIY